MLGSRSPIGSMPRAARLCCSSGTGAGLVTPTSTGGLVPIAPSELALKEIHSTLKKPYPVPRAILET
jgi:hypothetical protein